MSSEEEMQMIAMKYPEINEFFDDSHEQSMPVFIKLMATVLFIRQKLGYHVDKTEVFYCHVSKLDTKLFSTVETEDLPILLELFVSVACDYICGADIIDFDDVKAQESKRKVQQRLYKYIEPN